MATALRDDPDLRVELARGGFGELRVSVDGKDVYEASRLLYPRPARVVQKVRTSLGQLAKG